MNGAINSDISQQELYEQTFKTFEEGKIIKGKVVKIDGEGVLVDVGYKCEGVIPATELSLRKDLSSASEVLQIGDEIDVYVVRFAEDEEGGIILSKRRADLEKTWSKLRKAFEKGEVITATAIERVKGGLLVDLGVRGFVPASHVARRSVRNLEEFVGEPLRLKIIEFDRARNKVVLSQKIVLEEEYENQKNFIFKELREGQIYQGRVARITDFGVFVNLGGGVDGLVHLSELSWSRIKNPKEVVAIGDIIEVMILKLDPDKERISLSLRQALPDPWQNIGKFFKEGMIVNGVVTRLAKNYIFVEVKKGIEGLVPLTELVGEKKTTPAEIVKVDEDVSVKILEIKPNERRMLLSIRQAEDEKAQLEAMATLDKESNGNGTITLGEMIKFKQELKTKK